jgi:hypothetical protein
MSPFQLPNTTLSSGTNLYGKTQNRLVGQMVDLKAVLQGPAGIKPPRVQWTVPGNVLADYVDTDNSGTQTTLAGRVTTEKGTTYTITGKNQPEVKFFWALNDSGQATQDRVVSASIEPIWGTTFLEDTTFHVSEPTYTFNSINPGTTRAFQNNNGQWEVSLGDNSVTPFHEGISVDGHVQLPAGFPSGGQWKVLQLLTFGRTANAVPIPSAPGAASTAVHLPLNGTAMLDVGDPYQWYWKNNGPVQRSGAAAVYDVGHDETTIDFPESPLAPMPVDLPGQPTKRMGALAETIHDSYKMFLMFKPAGDSRWVPLYLQAWTWNADVSVDIPNNKYDLNAAGTNGPNPVGSIPDGEPQWTTLSTYNLPNWVT